MEEEPRKIATLEGNGYVLREKQRVGAHYYLDVFEESSGSRRYSGMLALSGETVLDTDHTYSLMLEDGRQLELQVTGSHFSIMGPPQYGVVGQGDPGLV